MAKNANEADKRKKMARLLSRPSIYDEVELSLSENLGRRVKVLANKGKGTLQIEFYNVNELKDLANKLGE